jgi:hypothetical protein
MRRLGYLALCLGILAIGTAGSARASTLAFTGTLEIRLAQSTVPFTIAATGSAEAVASGDHLSSLLLPGGSFGPFTSFIPTLLPGTASALAQSIDNLSGSFTGLSGGSGSGTMGLAGILRICIFSGLPCNSTFVPIPVALTQGAGFGVGGTQVSTVGGLVVTAQHAPWTLGQPGITLHTAGTSVTMPELPGGFAHGPASLTSGTAQASGVVQLVTVSKVFTTLTGALPEFRVTGVLTLRFVPEPGRMSLLISAGLGLAAAGGWRRGR